MNEIIIGTRASKLALFSIKSCFESIEKSFQKFTFKLKR